MGYKIEIVLISIAVFLCGAIVLGVSFAPKTPTEVEVFTSSVYREEIVDKTEKVDVEVQNYKVNINTATKEELMQLRGIGDVISQRVIDYRKSNRFDTIDEIVEVNGIGEKKFEDIKNYITVE